jgi:hypothetical protein
MLNYVYSASQDRMVLITVVREDVNQSVFYDVRQFSVIFRMTKQTIIQKRSSEGRGLNREPHNEKYECYALSQVLVYHDKCRIISFYYFDVK